MGSCVSKKAAARAGAVGKEPALLPPEKEVAPPPPPPVVVVEEEVKEVLSETAVPASRPPRPPEPDDKEVVKRRNIDQRKEEVVEEEEASESASVASAAVEKEKAKTKGGGEQEVEQKAVRAARRRTPEKRRPPKDGNGRARSPSPRRQGQGEHPAPPRPPRREQQPPVVSGIGCRSGRFSPSAARRAAESAAVRRTNSARMDADMTPLPHSSAKRSLTGGGVSKRGDPGERSGRRPESPTSKRSSIPPTSPAAAIHRQASVNGGSATRKTATLDQTKPQCKARDGSDESALEEGREQAAVAEGGALGQNPSVAMECFIFL